MATFKWKISKIIKNYIKEQLKNTIIFNIEFKKYKDIIYTKRKRV